MKRILLLVSLSVTICGQAQIMESWGWKALCEADTVCQYGHVRYNSVTEGPVTELMLLEIGGAMSKFYSFDTFEYDSLAYTPEGRQELNRRFDECLRLASGLPKKEKLKTLMEIPSRESEYIVYKNYPEQGTMLVQDAQSKQYYTYMEQMPLQDWEIMPDTMNILGYTCQKAVCQWRGREYTAWFAADIPTRDGPYKFCGLPGLIMKVEDSEQRFCFTIQQIATRERKTIYLAEPVESQPQHYVKVERKEVIAAHAEAKRKLLKTLQRDLLSLRDKQIDLDVMEIDCIEPQ